MQMNANHPWKTGKLSIKADGLSLAKLKWSVLQPDSSESIGVHELGEDHFSCFF